MVYHRLPKTAVVHWDVSGQADDYGTRFSAALSLPFIDSAGN
ncbi:MAG: DUF1648 domain-containing protein [Acetomicrobium flavidum]|nr:DUF1648 domain-containing protein [Acetomicrobium flavidum]